MALIDVECQSSDCGTINEVYRPAADWPATPACPDCGQPTKQIHLPGHLRTLPDAVVVYQAPDGSFRFPGATDGSSTAKYDRMGFNRIEARGFAAVRRLEAEINRHESSNASRKSEQIAERREHGEALRRSELRGRMQSMSTLGRDVARAAMRHTDQKAPREGRSRDMGFYIDCFSNDRSNRDESRDDHGKRRRD
jgi:hypothetical protein